MQGRILGGGLRVQTPPKCWENFPRSHVEHFNNELFPLRLGPSGAFANMLQDALTYLFHTNLHTKIIQDYVHYLFFY
jgi:hypothetical protein